MWKYLETIYYDLGISVSTTPQTERYPKSAMWYCGGAMQKYALHIAICHIADPQ